MANAPAECTQRRWTLGRQYKHVLLLLAAGMMTLCAGCAVGQLIGGMAASAHRAGSHEVKAKYSGLTDKSFAVIVSADRGIQADYPEIVPLFTRDIARRLSESCGASGMISADDVLRFQYQRPGWVAMSPGALAEALGVQRLVYIDLAEFALNDPGNSYLWAGRAVGKVGVIETDGRISDDFVFNEAVRVTYPDQEGLGPMQIPRDTVYLELSRRFITRVSWMFFQHEEPNVIKY